MLFGLGLWDAHAVSSGMEPAGCCPLAFEGAEGWHVCVSSCPAVSCLAGLPV